MQIPLMQSGFQFSTNSTCNSFILAFGFAGNLCKTFCTKTNHNSQLTLIWHLTHQLLHVCALSFKWFIMLG